MCKESWGHHRGVQVDRRQLKRETCKSNTGGGLQHKSHPKVVSNKDKEKDLRHMWARVCARQKK